MQSALSAIKAEYYLDNSGIHGPLVDENSNF